MGTPSVTSALFAMLDDVCASGKGSTLESNNRSKFVPLRVDPKAIHVKRARIRRAQLLSLKAHLFTLIALKEITSQTD